MNGHLYIFQSLYARHFSLKRYLDSQKSLSRMSEDQIAGRIKAELPKSPYYSTEAAYYREIGDSAFIPVQGLLTPEVDVFEMIMWGTKQTSYKAIIDSLEMAQNNPDITTAYLEINSGGGYSDGMYETLDAISDFRESGKKCIAVVSDYCCSAAYGIASQCDLIVAKNNGSTFGSIGVAATFTDWSAFYEKMGVKEITITNDDSTDKRPDISTDHGKAVYVSWLNADFEVFFEYIQSGRSKNTAFLVDQIKALKGKVVTAKKAVALGLADMIQKNYIETNSNGGNKSGISASAGVTINKGAEMPTLKELCAQDENLQKELDSMLGEVSKSDSASLAVAEEKGANAERTRMLSIIDNSGVQMSATAKDALITGKSLEQYAVTMLSVHTGKSLKTPDALPSIPSVDPQEEALLVADDSQKSKSFIDKL